MRQIHNMSSLGGHHVKQFNGLKTEIMNDKVKELIKLYEAILHGKEEKMGLFDCYDNYYVGCWDEQLKEVENLKQELDISCRLLPRCKP